MSVEKYYTILTKIGKASIADATTTGKKIDFKYLALGDALNEPIEEQESLAHEVWRGSIGSITTDETNENWIILESVIPSDVGGFSIKEVGIFDDSDKLLAVGKLPETYKPSVDQGTSKELKIRIILEVSNTSPINLQIDTSVVVATKKDIETLQNTVTTQMDNLTQDINSVRSETTEQVNQFKTDIQELDYNVYQLNLQQYYDGKYPVKRGFFYDGFINSNVIDSLHSTKGLLNTSKKALYFNNSVSTMSVGGNMAKQFGYSSSKDSRLAQTFSISETKTLQSITVRLALPGGSTASDSARIKIYHTSSSSTRYPSSYIASSSNTVALSGLPTYGGYAMMPQRTFNFSNLTLSPGRYSFVVERTGSYPSSFSGVWLACTSSDSLANERMTVQEGGSWNSKYNDNYDVEFTARFASPIETKTYQTKVQNFINPVSKVVLYIKYTKHNNVTLTPSISIGVSDSFKIMTLEGSPYAVDGGTEAKYTYESATPHTRVKFKLQITGVDTSSHATVNEYGCIFGVI
ncbi:phage tail protein [Tepidibacter hydrothermalis]|uniref:Phage tail protein n=1 Tax=Tepidibacter hydrothermalis TaxID=3036126 RepID=A0ABY8EKI7_9FIRM|nr:phage tail protein [Tepidibacter hydrothermalis]WFD12447.1 phage tail protein [Tepidibacter hydrothermalis]